MYIEKSAIEDYLLIDIDGSMDVRIDSWITAAQNYVENYTGRKFETPAADETKYFDGHGGRTLYIDDMTTITSVQTLELDGATVDETLVENTDFFAYPLNDTPKHILKLTPESDIGSWPIGKKRIKIVGKFGYKSTVPDDIKLVVTQLVAAIINVGRQGAEGGIKSESLGDYSASYGSLDDIATRLGVKQILDTYKLLEI